MEYALTAVRFMLLLMFLSNVATCYALAHHPNRDKPPFAEGVNKTTWLVGLWGALFAVAMGWL